VQEVDESLGRLREQLESIKNEIDGLKGCEFRALERSPARLLFDAGRTPAASAESDDPSPSSLVASHTRRPLPADLNLYFSSFDGGRLSAGSEAPPGSDARILPAREAKLMIGRNPESLSGVWPVLQRSGQLVALDYSADDSDSWPVVQVAENSKDRLASSWLPFLRVVCAELRFDADRRLAGRSEPLAAEELVEIARTRCLRDPGFGENWLDLSEALLMNGDSESAEQALNEGIRAARPVAPALVTALGVAELLRGESEAAGARFERAIELAPLTAKDHDARLDAASLLLVIGRRCNDTVLMDRAGSALGESLNATAGFWRSEVVRACVGGFDDRAGLALEALSAVRPEDTDQAVLQTAVKESAGTLNALHLAKDALENGDPERALPLARQAVAHFPDLGLAQATLAEALNATREPGALQAAQRAVSLNPVLVDGWREMGDAYFEQRRWTDALEAYDGALKLDKSYGLLHAKRAQVLLEESRRLEALEAISDAAAYGGDAFFLAAVKGDVLSAMGKHANAAECYEQALLYEPQDHWVLHQGALEHREAGNFDRAAELFELAIEFDRDGCHQTLVDYAELMKQVGRIGDAVRLYKRAVEAVPTESSWRESLREAEKELLSAPN